MRRTTINFDDDVFDKIEKIQVIYLKRGVKMSIKRIVNNILRGYHVEHN